MDNKLLSYYNQELAFIRRLGGEFAEAHPKIAGRLRMSSEGVEDPHVSRLIEAFALLNARIRHKLDDDFPQLSQALLAILYPHYQAPIPAMTVAQMHCEPSKADIQQVIPKHTQLIASREVKGIKCTFRTCSECTLLPVNLKNIKFSGRPLAGPAQLGKTTAEALLHIQLNTIKEDGRFDTLGLDPLRFFIHMQPQHAYVLYEVLCTQVVAIALAKSAADPDAIWLDPGCMRPVGFGKYEELLPYPPHAFMGYRLLTEFFSFPEKFLFFQLEGITKQMLANYDEELSLYFYIAQEHPILASHIDNSSLLLNCVPSINLFERQASPIVLDHTQTEYQLTARDTNDAESIEVYSVETVSTKHGKQPRYYQPLYGLKHDSQDQTLFWYPVRKPVWETNRYSEQSTELCLSFVDLDCESVQEKECTIDVAMLCSNRDLPNYLAFSRDEVAFTVVGSGGSVSKVTCVTPITTPKRPILTKGTNWRLISHLSLNHLSLTDGAESVNVLKEILRLYNFENNEQINAMIGGVIALDTECVTARYPHGGGNTFWRGTEIRLTLDEDKFSGGGLFLFASVLSHFFALYSSLNSFTRLTLVTKQRGEVYQWPLQTGEQTLL